MKISIIVPAYNEEKLIAETLQRIITAMAAFLERGWSSELIVCDNNSTDQTAELALAGGAQLVFEPINQIGRARNRGAASAKGDWLLFIDADSHPSAELFRDMIAAIERGNCLAGGSTIRLDGPGRLARWSTKLWNLISRSTRALAGSFIFCNAEAFRQIGGFNQELFASEELDLTRRLKKLARPSGKRIVILHNHPLATSARKFHLYSGWEYLRFLCRTAFGLGRTLKSAEECHLWYDGRR